MIKGNGLKVTMKVEKIMTKNVFLNSKLFKKLKARLSNYSPPFLVVFKQIWKKVKEYKDFESRYKAL